MKLVRAKTKKDYQLLVNIDRECFPPGDVCTDVDDWKTGECYLVWVDGMLVGATALVVNKYFDWTTYEYEPAPGCMYIASTAILPTQQGLGYGRQVKEWQIKLARKRGCFMMKISTREANIAMRSLNKSVGFKVVGIIDPAYSEPTERGVDMELIL